MKKPTLFNSNCTDGMVDLYFSEEEIVSLVELLIMTKQICVNASNSLDSVTNKVEKTAFEDKIQAASSLLEKIISDSSPGVPQGDLN